MKFFGPNFEFIVTSFEILQVIDDMNGRCRIAVRLTGDNVQCVHEFADFTYQNNTWEDAEINAFVSEKLNENI